ncbi:MAG: hypothetical protein ABSF12_03160 [Bryobacteraceae bacterium]|jgi:hypothetical protein
MADSRYRLVVEEFIREIWLPSSLGGEFKARPVALCDGGIFNCDAVSDAGILASICTNSGKTSSGRNATPKLMKIRSDILFMLRAEAKRRLVVVTCVDMHALCEQQKRLGRMPREIEFHLAEIEIEMKIRLLAEHARGAGEMGH